jgi:hypothetical protein
MKPVEFPQQNRVWAKNQPQYLPLPAYSDDTYTHSFWKLSWRERFKVFFFGRIWLSQMNRGNPLQPQRMSVDSPFETE